ncbi:hypothetical protein ACQYAD_11020 [Neobacillus sp. SM06]
MTIDIDRLLEATIELKIEQIDFPLKKIEIDTFLENTREIPKIRN